MGSRLRTTGFGPVKPSRRVSAGPYSAGRFAARVLNVVRRIPPGRVATYGDVAAMAGRPRAWRAVGNIMRGCSTAGVPCHRVIAAGGLLGGYGGVTGLKRELLRAEGVPTTATRVREFEARRWRRQPGNASPP